MSLRIAGFTYSSYALRSCKQSYIASTKLLGVCKPAWMDCVGLVLSFGILESRAQGCVQCFRTMIWRAYAFMCIDRNHWSLCLPSMLLKNGSKRNHYVKTLLTLSDRFVSKKTLTVQKTGAVGVFANCPQTCSVSTSEKHEKTTVKGSKRQS